MPGDVVEFAEGPEPERLLTALGDLADHGGDFVLVGGLAVAARLRTFHRATQDLDALVDEDRARFRALTVEAVAGASVENGRLFVDGVEIDIIDIDPTTAFDAIEELSEPLDRLFTAGHLFAHRDGVELVLRSGTSVAVVTVASARSLLVTKLHAYVNPRRDPRKHPSDALDVFELGRQLVTGPDDHYDGVPDVVRASASWAVDRIGQRPDEMVRKLAATGHRVRVQEISELAALLLEDLR